jgi:hypothetical protein
VRWRRESLQESSHEDEEAVESSAVPSTEAISQIRSEGQDSKAAESGHGAEDAEQGTHGVVENCGRVSHEASISEHIAYNPAMMA